VLLACYAEITALMQNTLDRLAREHPHPILERLGGLELGRTVRRIEDLFVSLTPLRRRGRRHPPSRRATSAPLQAPAGQPSA
jgi:hypothetical protein